MTHLGERLTAPIDGELDHDARDRLLAHAIICAQCREELGAHRRFKSQVRALADPQPPPELLSRLVMLAAQPDPPLCGQPDVASARRRSSFL